MLWLILIYPLLVCGAQTQGPAVAVWVAWLGLIGIGLILSARLRAHWVVTVTAGVVALGLLPSSAARYLPFLPAVLIPLALLVIFSRGLAGSGPSLVTRIATAIDGELPPEVIAYTRHVNYLWCGLLALMALANLVIAVWTGREEWALLIDCFNYAAVGLTFMGEYLFRRVRFPRREHRSLSDYIRRVAHIDYRRLAG